MHRFAALIIASAVAITPAQAQTASELRISGTVEKLDGNLAALSLSRGISLVVRLDSEPRVNSVAKGSGSDLKAGSQVSIQAKSGQSGDLIATQIVLFGPGSNRPDAEPRARKRAAGRHHQEYKRLSRRTCSDRSRCFEPPLVRPGQAIHRSSRASRLHAGEKPYKARLKTCSINTWRPRRRFALTCGGLTHSGPPTPRCAPREPARSGRPAPLATS